MKMKQIENYLINKYLKNTENFLISYSLYKKYFIPFLISFILVIISIFFIIEFLIPNFFFDKFIYQKKVEYGYFLNKDSINNASIEKRFKDVSFLRNLIKDEQQSLKKNDELIRIAIIGDSFVWGQGVKENQRFPHLLQKDLESILNKPVEVYSFASPGDSIIDLLAYYETSKKHIPDFDAYVFVLVSNDITPRPKGNSFGTNFFDGENYVKICEEKHGKMIIDITNEDWFLLPTDLLIARIDENYANVADNDSNKCLYDEIIPQLPDENAIYIIPDNFDNAKLWQAYLSRINDEKQVVDIHDIAIKKGLIKEKEELRVSEQETHPSKLAHKLFSQLIIDQLIDILEK